MAAQAQQPRGARLEARRAYIHLDAEYITEVRPDLTDCEARVYEALLLECDAACRPATAQAVAAITRLHPETARRTMRRLEQLGLIVSHWQPPPPSPFAKRTVAIVRDYTQARALLAAQRDRATAKHVAEDPCLR